VKEDQGKLELFEEPITNNEELEKRKNDVLNLSQKTLNKPKPKVEEAKEEDKKEEAQSEGDVEMKGNEEEAPQPATEKDEPMPESK